ncbi:hypothetical protein ASE70_14925 [Sphingomonas sp. Leaf22]|uniref:hypothetical protein n=1 Tax=Sphingomonas sp. Leaf22 TaxID=1735687 RepID=UPI0006F30AC0|nr:hypothetical protein [Sphingomonas sp. Leaf22]KQM92205.1 hypothetical protein ASE70_14925 [Sphingomonas sp. Leaf22]
MLHTPIIPAGDVDPDITQAIRDFRSVAARIRDLSGRAIALPAGDKVRKAHEAQIAADMDLFRARAERIGGGWTEQSLLIAVQADTDARARRVRHPQYATERTYADRVQQAMAREATAKTALDAAQLEVEAATSEREAAEHASRQFDARRRRA